MRPASQPEKKKNNEIYFSSNDRDDDQIERRGKSTSFIDKDH